MPPKNKNKKFLAKTAADAAAKSAASESAASLSSLAIDSGRPTSEDLGFFIRSGPDACLRSTLNMDIHISGIVLHAGKEELISNGTLALTYGTKYGLVGRNGVGKSTLLKAIASKTVKLPDFLFVVHVEQECTGEEITALDAVLAVDKERLWLIEKEKYLVDNDLDEHQGISLNEIYERLDQIDSDSAEARAAMVLAGLGFDAQMQMMKTREFSGGWRMRIALAQALFLQPDLLLLDEPTNHLDVNALTWLEEFLKTWEKTVMIVSHDRNFLNTVTTQTIFLHRKRLWYYGGSYDTFLKVRAEQRANQAAVAKDQEARSAQLKAFIQRFGHGNKKMAKQAQSRMKMLKKMENEAVEVDYDDPYLRLEFPSASYLPPPCISVIDAAFGYEGCPLLYENLNFGLDMDSRVAIVGPNGAGKSTFLKLVMGDIIPSKGWVNRHCKLRLACFTQHHIDMMDLDKDAVTHMRSLDKDVPIEEARKYLGRFGLSGDLALKPIRVLSGGQKSRLAFSELAFKQPHILLLDEPTNHLDLETIEALAMAINTFDGGVVLVSHDERLISLIADEIWSVNKGVDGKPGSVTVFDGSFEEYKELLKKEYFSGAGIAAGKGRRKAGDGAA